MPRGPQVQPSKRQILGYSRRPHNHKLMPLEPLESFFAKDLS